MRGHGEEQRAGVVLAVLAVVLGIVLGGVTWPR